MTVSGAGGCSGTFIDATIDLTTNEGAAGTTYALPVQAVVANDYYECPKDPETVDTLYNGVLALFVNANCGEAIRDSASYPDTAHDIFFEGGSIIATSIGADTVVGRYMREDRYAGVRDRLYTDQCEPGWEPPLWIAYTKDVFMHDLEPPANHKWFWWEMSKQIKFFRPDAPDHYKHLLIKYVKVKRKDPPTWWPDQTPFTSYEDTYIGVAEDIDCPFDTLDNQNGRNRGGYDGTNHIAWQQGFDWTGSHPSYNNYYAGIALANGGQPGESIVPYGSYCVRNDSSLYPQGGWGWDDVELYGFASSAGNTIVDPDSVVDRSYVFTARKIDAGSDENAEAAFTVILAVARDGLSQLQAYVDTGRAIVQRAAEPGHGYPAICGDVNGRDGVSAGDLVYLISYLFRGQDLPLCPMDRGDCNSDGTVDAADVVTLIAYLFRYGAPPDCPGIWAPGW
jgi:hypothetical protein